MFIEQWKLGGCVKSFHNVVFSYVFQLHTSCRPTTYTLIQAFLFLLRLLITVIVHRCVFLSFCFSLASAASCITN